MIRPRSTSRPAGTARRPRQGRGARPRPPRPPAGPTRRARAGQAAALGADGRMPITEVTFDRAGAASPFGDDIEFPVAPESLAYEHPKDERPTTDPGER